MKGKGGELHTQSQSQLCFTAVVASWRLNVLLFNVVCHFCGNSGRWSFFFDQYLHVVMVESDLSGFWCLVSPFCPGMFVHDTIIKWIKSNQIMYWTPFSSFSSHRTELYSSIPQTCVPIVYHPDYNITFMGLEKLHPFDAGKWGKVIHFLKGERIRSTAVDGEDVCPGWCTWSLSEWFREAERGGEHRRGEWAGRL